MASDVNGIDAVLQACDSKQVRRRGKIRETDHYSGSVQQEPTTRASWEIEQPRNQSLSDEGRAMDTTFYPRESRKPGVDHRIFNNSCTNECKKDDPELQTTYSHGTRK
jgi:hypothetical protein